MVSIHAPRVGCDSLNFWHLSRDISFQFTHPVWGATFYLVAQFATAICFNSRTPCGVRHPIFVPGGCSRRCFNSRTPCGVRLPNQTVDLSILVVSIHAPRVGCDGRELDVTRPKDVSIHAPRVGCDDVDNLLAKVSPVFQFTHPVWGATLWRPPPLVNLMVSIHAPRVGCDLV